MPITHQFVRIDFERFKAFKAFTLQLRHFNILVGPNNSGKSTILAAFRILAAALRKAGSRRPVMLRGPTSKALGYVIELSSISVAEENIFYNYDDKETASVKFQLSNNNELTLYFPEQGVCFLFADAQGSSVVSPSAFRAQFNCPIGFVPILGPIEHIENLYEREAARLAIYNYRAARNFRNIWYHFPEKFDQFRSALNLSWPGMDVQRPVVDRSHEKPRLHMFCPEERIPREIFWAGFGFQVWCQMLTQIVQSSETSLFLIDEPDIYLHSDLQRQLLGLLRNMGPDILIATHSTEIITEAEADDIVLINKRRNSARRLKQPSQLKEVFKILGSNLNPILTQLAKTRRAIFVEGSDFQILSKFARKIGLTKVANRSEFAVIPVEACSPERIRSLKTGIEATLGGSIAAGAIFDRDYRCSAECESITKECLAFCELVEVHPLKEIENYLLVPAALDRAASRRVKDRFHRGGPSKEYKAEAAEFLAGFALQKQSYVTAQVLACRRLFERKGASGLHEATITEAALNEFGATWEDASARLNAIPGKEALSAFNEYLQKNYSVSITPTSIVDAMFESEVSPNVRRLLSRLSDFSSASPP